MKTEYTEEEVKSILETVESTIHLMKNMQEEGRVAIDKLVGMGYNDEKQIKHMNEQMWLLQGEIDKLDAILDLIKKSP